MKKKTTKIEVATKAEFLKTVHASVDWKGISASLQEKYESWIEKKEAKGQRGALRKGTKIDKMIRTTFLMVNFGLKAADLVFEIQDSASFKAFIGNRSSAIKGKPTIASVVGGPTTPSSEQVDEFMKFLKSQKIKAKGGAITAEKVVKKGVKDGFRKNHVTGVKSGKLANPKAKVVVAKVAEPTSRKKTTAPKKKRAA